MWILQNILIVVGSTVLGTLLGVITVWMMFYTFLITPRSDPMGTGMGLYIGGLLFGAPLGALVGLIGSICCVRSQYERGTWNRVVWAGILIGLLMSVSGLTQSIHILKSLSQAYGWLGTAFLKIGYGTVGGMLAAMGLAIYRVTKKAR
jgi:hypothetical protein